jgi:hypothetical protein
MSESATSIIRQPNARIALKAVLYLILIVSSGCFGPAGMHYDIQQYNKEVLSSEKEMLPYNIAAMNEGQPPHFMMVSNIAATPPILPQQHSVMPTCGTSYSLRSLPPR